MPHEDVTSLGFVSNSCQTATRVNEQLFDLGIRRGS